MDSFFNKKGLIEHTVKVNIYYWRHRERTKNNVIRDQKWSVILRIPWLACHNPRINWRTEKVKIIRCLEKYEKQ